MVFSSIIFIFAFLPITLLLYYIAPEVLKNPVLLLFSLIFYAWGEPVYVVLMIFSILFNYVMGLDIEARMKIGKYTARRSLIFTIVVDIGLLGFFKYYGFFAENLSAVLPFDLPQVDVALPVGISFYTFQTLSYVIDIYRGETKVQRNLIAFGTYVTMFPQLIAGPIVQYKDIDEQLRNRKLSRGQIGEGAVQFIRGLTKKVVFANNIGAVFTVLTAQDIGEMSVLSAWLACIAYTFQIYFDFGGYSDMAIGLGKMLGFEFLPNFNHPYISVSITDFWRRWHISLSTWFRDYIYIPLGGSYVSAAKHIRNMFAVWLFTGFWHGAAWNFAFWGLYYGVLLTIEKYFLLKHLERAPKPLQHVYTMLIVMIGWVFFSSPSLGNAVSLLGVMFGFGDHPLVDDTGLYYLTSNLLLIGIMALASTPALHRLLDHGISMSRRPQTTAIICYTVMFVLCVSFLVNETYNPFLYFRF